LGFEVFDVVKKFFKDVSVADQKFVSELFSILSSQKIKPVSWRILNSGVSVLKKDFVLWHRSSTKIEWEDFGNCVLIEGENDTLECAQQLVQLFRGRFVKVNLIPWNPVVGIFFHRPSSLRVQKFFDVLVRAKILTTI